MTFSPEQIEILAAPLSREHIESREQAGRKVSYLEAWYVIAEANRIFGFDGWNRKMVECRCVTERECRIGVGTKYEKDGWRVGYVARTRVTVGEVLREGTGYGSGIDADLGSAHESAIKEAESDAMKRALMTFGNQFGLALYDKAQAGVEAPQRPPQRPLRPPQMPAMAGPGNTQMGNTQLVPPPSATGGLREISQRIHHALEIADIPERIDGILRANQAALREIETLGPKTYAALMAYAGERRAELIANPRATESEEQLMGQP